MSTVWATVSTIVHLPRMFPPMDFLFEKTDWICWYVGASIVRPLEKTGHAVVELVVRNLFLTFSTQNLFAHIIYIDPNEHDEVTIWNSTVSGHNSQETFNENVSGTLK